MIIPVKSAGKKSRLAGVLGREEREEFTRLLLADVLHAVEGAGLIGGCRVVSSDMDAIALAEDWGASGVAEEGDAGVNAAVERGARGTPRREDLLIIPADLPLLRPSELLHLLEARSGGADVVITPSWAFDGTNALAFSLSSPLELSYDDDSFRNHLSAAARQGRSVQVCTEPGLTFDVDSAADFTDLARSGRTPSARFARRVLR